MHFLINKSKILQNIIPYSENISMTLMSRHSTSFTAYITFNSTVILTKLRKWGEYSTVPIFEMQIRKKKYIYSSKRRSSHHGALC